MITTLASLVFGWFAAASGQDGARPVDGVAAQAGDAVITLSELNRFVEESNGRRPVTTREDAQKLTVQGLRDIVTLRLEAQAGEDIGIDHAQIESMIAHRVDQEREESGLVEYIERLEKEGSDAFGALEDRTSELYRYLWRAEKVGVAVAGRRPTRDRYIRPGELRAMFVENREALSPTVVRFQVLVVESRAAGGAELARASCEDAKQRIEAGEEFGALVLERGSELQDTEGVTPEILVPGIIDPELKRFAESATVGALSSVRPIIDAKGQADPEIGYQLVKLYDRREGEELEFATAQVQLKLRSYFSNTRENRLLERERARLRAEGYSWVHPRLRGLPVAETASSR